MTQATNALSTPLAFPARPMPIAQPVGSGWCPVIRHPNRPEYVTFERFFRKAKTNPDEALAYAARVIGWREHFAGFKRRRREATMHPRHVILEAAE